MISFFELLVDLWLDLVLSDELQQRGYDDGFGHRTDPKRRLLGSHVR
mgnify:FL=1